MADWSTLLKDLLNLISKRLDSSSYDLIKFRSVCSSWRSSTSPPLQPHHHNHHHLPILPDNGFSPFPDSAVGFRLSQRTVLLIKPHTSPNHGWIIKTERNNNKTTLIDPLNDRKHRFSRTIDMSKFRIRELCCEFKLRYFNTVGDVVDSLYLEKAVVKYLDEDKFVLLTIHVSGKLAVFKSWDRSWTVINDMPSPYDDVILFEGRLSAVDNNGRTVVVELSDLTLVLVGKAVFGGDKKFLIESCGEMLLVDMYLSMEEVVDEEGRRRRRFWSIMQFM